MKPCCPCFCSPDPCCDSVHITLKQSIGSLALNRVKKHISTTQPQLWAWHSCSSATLAEGLLPIHPHSLSPTLPQIICCRGHPRGHPTTWVPGNVPTSNLSPLVTDAAAGRVAMAAHPLKPALALGTVQALPCPGWALGCCQPLLSPHTLHMWLLCPRPQCTEDSKDRWQVSSWVAPLWPCTQAQCVGITVPAASSSAQGRGASGWGQLPHPAHIS